MAAIAAIAIAIVSLVVQQVMSTFQTRTCSYNVHEILLPWMGGGVGNNARAHDTAGVCGAHNYHPLVQIQKGAFILHARVEELAIDTQDSAEKLWHKSNGEFRDIGGPSYLGMRKEQVRALIRNTK